MVDVLRLNNSMFNSSMNFQALSRLNVCQNSLDYKTRLLRRALSRASYFLELSLNVGPVLEDDLKPKEYFDQAAHMAYFWWWIL